jgi:hypothetical protein
MGVVNHLKELGSVSTIKSCKSLNRTMLGSRTSFPLVMVNLIIDWFLIMSFVENPVSEVSDQRKTIYKLLLAKPLIA